MAIPYLLTRIVIAVSGRIALPQLLLHGVLHIGTAATIGRCQACMASQQCDELAIGLSGPRPAPESQTLGYAPFFSSVALLLVAGWPLGYSARAVAIANAVVTRHEGGLCDCWASQPGL